MVALGVGSCSAAFERSGVFAGQRRAAAAQLGSAGRWQRQRGVGSGSVAAAQLGSAGRWQRQRGVGVGSVADAAQRRSAERSSARQRSALAVVAQWWQRSGGQDAAAQWRQRALSAAA